jgi:hypothetical protein
MKRRSLSLSLSTYTSVLLSCGQTGELLINVPTLFVFLSVQVPKGRTRYEKLSILWIVQAARGMFYRNAHLTNIKNENWKGFKTSVSLQIFHSTCYNEGNQEG